MTSVIATPTHLGWTPHEPGLWKSLQGHWWRYTVGEVPHILDELGQCALHSEWAKARTHIDGQGLAHGVSTCGFNMRLAWLNRRGMHGTKQG